MGKLISRRCVVSQHTPPASIKTTTAVTFGQADCGVDGGGWQDGAGAMDVWGLELREFVYLSDGKISQFLSGPERLRLPGALRLNTPVGGVDEDAHADGGEWERVRRLKKISKNLEEKGRWFADDGLRPRDWVWFEAPLHCVTLRGDYRHMVLFADPVHGQDLEYDDKAACRLLFHGSAHRLIGFAPMVVDGPVPGIDGGSSIGTTFLTTAGHVVRALSVEHDPIAEGAESPLVCLNGSGVRDLLTAVDTRNEGASTAAWMYGFAQVTADLPAEGGLSRCVMASPLALEVMPA
ncbi:SAVMC3_10250 family protein [Streptomyces sp. NPDC051771]|uniref:SAVMC3_10250 family protein n=1 Tax=Streptomyces sp. NPDC051771 TaxID=3154847 RepID=UPI00343F30A7